MIKLRSDGFTVTEIMVGIFIFAVVAALMLGSIQTADRIKGRSAVNNYSAILASSEAERIRAAASYSDMINDTSYQVIMRDIIFNVERKIKENLENPRPGVEVEITVTPVSQSTLFSPLTFKLYQGFK